MNVMRWLVAFGLALTVAAAQQSAPDATERARRVQTVKGVPGLAAFWDFVTLDAETGRFLAHTPQGQDYPLDVVNYVRDFWEEGRAATFADIPRLGRGPFGDAVAFRAERDPTFRPTLLLPRARFHDGPLDVGGPGRSVSMVVWMVHQAGNHAVAGIWHEGTDLRTNSTHAKRVESGRRQYALFAGLAANAGA